MADCPRWFGGLGSPVCASPAGPVSSCCSPPSSSALLRPRRWWPELAHRQRVARPPPASCAIARIMAACDRRPVCVAPASLRSSMPTRLISAHRRCPARTTQWRSRHCSVRRSNLRYLHLSLSPSVNTTTKPRSRFPRISMETSYAETGSRDHRGRLRQLRSGLSGLGSDVLRAGAGVLRRTLLRLAALTTLTKATARETGRWLFCWPMPGRMPPRVPCL